MRSSLRWPDAAAMLGRRAWSLIVVPYVGGDRKRWPRLRGRIACRQVLLRRPSNGTPEVPVGREWRRRLAKTRQNTAVRNSVRCD